MSRLLLTLILLVSIVGTGCSNGKATVAPTEQSVMSDVKIRTSNDPSAPFPESASCAWDTGFPQLPDDVRVDPLVLETRLRDAISRVLAERNYRFRGYAPDFRVGYRVAITTDEFASGPGERYTVKDGWIPAMAGSRKLERGALLIEIIDAKSHRLVWQGLCEANVTMTADEQSKQDRLNRAVEAILAEFPPGSSPSQSAP